MTQNLVSVGFSETRGQIVPLFFELSPPFSWLANNGCLLICFLDMRSRGQHSIEAIKILFRPFVRRSFRAILMLTADSLIGSHERSSDVFFSWQMAPTGLYLHVLMCVFMFEAFFAIIQ